MVMKFLFFIPVLILLSTMGCAQEASKKEKTSSNLQNQKVGGSCEGCEAIYESPIPFEKLGPVDSLPDFGEPGPKLVISGVVYQSDGKTPAPNVVLYVYHTDQAGNYSKKGGEKGWALRHGYIRGWVKTNEKGEYRLYTLRPASYPNTRITQHIHPTIKEPDKNEYWIDSYLFEDDPFLTKEERNRQEERGGNGIIKLEKRDGILYGTRNIILGKNIPDYSPLSKK